MCSPGFDFGPGVLDGQEPVGVQAFIPEFPLEWFYKESVRKQVQECVIYRLKDLCRE